MNLSVHLKLMPLLSNVKSENIHDSHHRKILFCLIILSVHTIFDNTCQLMMYVKNSYIIILFF